MITFNSILQEFAQSQANALVRFDNDTDENIKLCLSVLECFCELKLIDANNTFVVEISSPNSCFTDKKEVTLSEMLHECIKMSREFEKEDF